MNDTQSALVKLQKAVSLDENCSHGLMALGAVLQSRNDIDGALQRYKKIGDYENEGSELWSNIGLCLFKKQKFIAVFIILELFYSSLYKDIYFILILFRQLRA